MRSGRKAIVGERDRSKTEALNRYSERFPGRVALMLAPLTTEEQALAEGFIREVRRGDRTSVSSLRPVPDLGLVVLDKA